MNTPNPRKLAIEVLNKVEQEGAYSNIAIQEVLRIYRLMPENRRLLTRLVYGVLENQMLIDAVINQYSKMPVKKMKPWVRCALRTGVYQLGWMERIPVSAAINETVKLVKLRYQGLAGFANGVLRTVERKGVELDTLDATTPEGMALLYSHPQWLVDRWCQRYGFEMTQQILKANNSPSAMSLRTNTLKIAPEDLEMQLKSEGVEVSQSPYLEYGLLVERLGEQDLTALPSFKEGLFTIQDTSSILVAEAIAPKKGDKVLDLCAAPGGKTTHLAEKMEDQGLVMAMDLYEHKIQLIQQNAQRLQLTSIEAVQGDAAQLREYDIQQFDHVLLDAPCSGFGIIRKKPEIRYNRKIEDIGTLAQTQFKLLTTASQYVKNHGQLIYSTCTMEYDENEAIIKGFLQKNPSFQLVDIRSRMPESIRKENAYIQILPNSKGLDGFFIAVLIKNT